METYVKPTIKILVLSQDDIIATSGGEYTDPTL